MQENKLILSGKTSGKITPDMVGLFFEDINFAADGGLYAEVLENRSFEAVKSKGENHTLEITYKGTPWHNEQFCALPAMEAGRRENIDPAMLMSIIRHISGFDFNYERENYGRGLLALDSIDGLEQIFVGARKLRAVLDTAKSEEDAIAAFYPGRDIQGVNAEWRKSPLKNGWVQDVLADIPFYRNNGFSNEPEDL